MRTRADADTVEARTDDTTVRRAALRQRRPVGEHRLPAQQHAASVFSTPYHVNLPGHDVARCNPVNAPPGCVSAWLDAAEPPRRGELTGYADEDRHESGRA